MRPCNPHTTNEVKKRGEMNREVQEQPTASKHIEEINIYIEMLRFRNEIILKYFLGISKCTKLPGKKRKNKE